MKWRELLRGESISWLLEEENPPVRYRTLTDLLDRPRDDPDVGRAQVAIDAHRPVAQILAAQKQAGYWIQPDYYLPKHTGTFWVLTMLADLGLTAEKEEIRRACEYLFTFQHEQGAFGRRRRVAGQGLVWEHEDAPCTQARIVRFLIQFGYCSDPRVRAGIDWLLATQRDDGMWLCRQADRRGCLRATLDVLRVAAVDAASAAHPAITRATAVVYDLLMEPHMGRYHVGHEWMDLEYPYFGYGLIPALDSLARLGYTTEQPKVAAAMEYLLGRQLPGGAWILDRSPYRLPIDVGQPGQPNKWLTLDALRVLRLRGMDCEGEGHL